MDHQHATFVPDVAELETIGDGPFCDDWQNPFWEQKGAQQGHPKFELQLPAPRPASTVSAFVHSLPFQTLHDPIGENSGSVGVAEIQWMERVAVD